MAIWSICTGLGLLAPLFTLLLGQVTGVVSLAALHPSSQARLDAFIASLRECRRIPGLQLAVVHLDDYGQDGQYKMRTTTRGYGLADIDQKISVTSDTRFCVASLTKAFTAVLLGKLLLRSK